MKKSFFSLLFIALSTFFSLAQDWEADKTKIDQYAPGGFDYNLKSFSASEVGERINHWTFDYSGVRTIQHAPAVGVHPRIYITPDEKTNLLYRLHHSAVGQEQLRVLFAYTALLNVGYANASYKGLYQKNTTYSRNNQRIEYIDNPGSYDVKLKYDAISAIDAPKGLLNEGSKILSNARFGSQMSAEAWICYINDPDEVCKEAPYPDSFNLTYRQRAEKLARAMTYWADAWLTLYKNNESVKSVYDQLPGGSMTFAVLYDMNFWAMTDDQRSTCRQALAKLCEDQPLHFAFNEPYATIGNWVGLDFYEVIPYMAIEGESGYNSIGFRNCMKAYYKYVNYACYDDGFYFEALGKGYLMMSNLIALARRGYSFLGHPHVRRFCDSYLPKLVVSHGFSFLGDDLYGGHDGGQTTLKPMTGDYRFALFDAVGLNFAYPNNPSTSFVWRNYVDNLNEKGEEFINLCHPIFNPGTHNYFDKMNAMLAFGDDWNRGDNNEWNNFEDHQKAALNAQYDYFSDGRGLGIMRSGFTSNSMYVQMNSRQNFGGHTSPDKNSITLNALGRIWFYREAANDAFQPEFFSSPMVDNKGVKLNLKDGTKARQPVKVLEFNSNDLSCVMAADATDAYNYEWDWTPGEAPENSTEPSQNGWEPINDWNFNRYLLHPIENDIMFTQPFYKYAYWACDNSSQKGYIEQMSRKKYNDLSKIIRTVALIRADKPYMVVVDDIQKNEGKGNFKSLFQLPIDLEQESISLAPEGADYLYDIIIREKKIRGTLGRRLLIRVLSHNGAIKDGKIAADIGVLRNISGDYGPVGDTINIMETNPLRKVIRNRLLLEADNVISPEFKLLIMPLERTDALPLTKWNSETGELTVWEEGSTTATKVVMTPSDNRTKITVSNTQVPLKVSQVVNDEKPRLVNNILQNLSIGDSIVINSMTGSLVWNQVAMDYNLTLPHEVKGYYLISIIRKGKLIASFKNPIS